MVNFLGTALLLSSLPLINAQSSTATAASSTTSTTSATGSVHTIDVGEDGLTFSPSSLTAAPGDKVEFHFYPQAHSVAQSSFANPCEPIDKGGFYSGLMVTTEESKTVFTVTVNNTDPIWYYCGAVGHCQAGMVGVINPPSSGSNTLASFKSAAANAKDTKTPAGVMGGVLGTASSSNSSSSSSASASASASGTATGTSSGSASKTSGSASAATTTNAASSLYIAGDVSALMLLGLFSWLMV